MENQKYRKPYTNKDKWIVSIISGLLFLLIASPVMYSVTDKIASTIGWSTANKSGCPKIGGLILHSVVFLLIVRLMMK